MVIFVLPCVIHDGFNFQYDASGHMCTWNFAGHTSSGTRFNYLKVGGSRLLAVDLYLVLSFGL